MREFQGDIFRIFSIILAFISIFSISSKSFFYFLPLLWFLRFIQDDKLFNCMKMVLYRPLLMKSGSQLMLKSTTGQKSWLEFSFHSLGGRASELDGQGRVEQRCLPTEIRRDTWTDAIPRLANYTISLPTWQWTRSNRNDA